ncbi:MAG: glycerate kinase [Actinobacteria bacterium]|nr:glycerate kinase [Actinomycetota bacterium]
MRILVAPDSFKGSLSATKVAAAVGRGLSRVNPGIEAVLVPMADGGEGTLDVLQGHGMELVEVPLRDHQGRLVRATVARREGFFFIESAQACRFEPGATPDMALTASSEGVGRLIEYALDQGATDIFLTLGGTASTDGGSGMLAHLGARILDQHGQSLPPGGGSLETAAGVLLSGIDPRVRKVTITVVTDVDAPLLGPLGAARQFGPQKGADARAVDILEAGLEKFCSLLGREAVSTPGAGAGGGIGYGALAGLGASAAPGAATIAEIVGLPSMLSECDGVITGEGSMDAQSFGGKVVGFVSGIAQERKIPVGVICGQRFLGNDADALLQAQGIGWVQALVDSAPSVDHATEHAEEWVEEVAYRIGREMVGS